jgi:regulator of protease activity HflC (stomatin/prohibitin superfamily)
MGAALIVVMAVLALLLFIYAAAGVRIVRPYQRGVKEMLGRFQETVDPGLRLIIPFAQTIRLVDMREQVVDVPPQEVITSDNVVVSVDAVVYYEPTDPQRLVYNVANFLLAVTKLAQTNLRNVVGDMQLDEALTSREKINVGLREILDDATDKWGVRVVRVEIQRIDPPPDVMASMHEQMKAERTRRAVVTEALGRREAAVTNAEGEKQAAVLRAEGGKQQQVLSAQGEADATRLRAEAEKFRQLTVADGEAEAIRAVYGAIHEGEPSPDLIAIKYLETLGRMANGKATKLFIPADMSGLLGSVGAVADLFQDSGDGGGEGDGGRIGSGGDGGDAARAERAERAARRAIGQSERRAEQRASVADSIEAIGASAEAAVAAVTAATPAPAATAPPPPPLPPLEPGGQDGTDG